MYLLVFVFGFEPVNFKMSAAISVPSRIALIKQQKQHNKQHGRLKTGKFLKERITFRNENEKSID
jgi:hypothetical protein